MIFRKYLLPVTFTLFLFLLSAKNSYSQCFQIESILVDACGGQEGLNEMVRFKVGPVAINTSIMSVDWPNNPWQGLAQNAFTAGKTADLNADILDAGGCGQLIEPTGGVLPANANVILVTSYNLDTTLNSFGALTDNIYILYQDNAATTSGHFANSGTGTRTLEISFNACTDTVTYDRALLIDSNGNTTAGDGAIVTFNPSGTPTYINNGCSAPVQPFTVDAGAASVNSCPGGTVSLNGTAQGHQTVLWSATSGTFSSPDNLSTNYTLSPSATGTITLTLTVTNSCGLEITDTINVVVTNSVTPTFNAVTPICSGAALFALPTTSNNGITGSWSPALNNTATTTYTFTPNVGQCASNTILTITVNTSVTPTFNPIVPICSGAALSALPTTSNNGITGSWSPALNNTATTTYTFTPNVGQCASNATLTITVNTSTTPTFNPVASICSGDVLSALPTISTNGIIGSWSPALNNTATTTYTFTPNVGQCASNATLTITVNTPATPAFNPVTPICIGDALSSLPTTSMNGITGSWSPVLDNTTTTTYTFTPNVGQCASITTLTITVNAANTVPTFNAVPAICSGDTLAALPTTSTNGITGSWSPVLNNTATTTYTFTPNAGQCASNATLTITVNTSTTPAFNPVAPICSGDTLSSLPTTSVNGVTGSWSPALNNLATTTYTFTPSVGQCASNATLTITVNTSLTPTFNAVAAICSGDVLSPLPTTSTNGIIGSWAPALNNTATTTYTFTPSAGQCASATTLTIAVNTANTIPTFNAILPICSGDALSALPTTSTNGITGNWSPALNNTATTTYTFTSNVGQCALNTTLTITVNSPTTPTFNAIPAICFGDALSPLPTTSTNGISGSWTPALNNTATTTYTFTPNSGQCASNATLTITVNTPTMPTFNPVAPICSGDTFSLLPTISMNGITGNWSPALNNTATTTYTFTPNTGQCASVTTLTITVNAANTIPTFNAVPAICSGDALSALTTTSNNGITGNWSPALNNTATTTYTFTPNAGQCASVTTLTITVNDIIIPDFQTELTLCNGETAPALSLTSPNGITGSWNPAAIDNTANGLYTFTPAAGQCSTAIILNVTVGQINFDLTQGCVNRKYLIQVNPIAGSNDLDQADYKWKDDNGNIVGTENMLNVTDLLANNPNVQFPVDYTLTITNAEGCTVNRNISVAGIFCSIPKGISPNNDDKNDDFDLTGMGVKDLTIFNRYGTQVFHYKNYTNQWKGLSSDGQTLPDATYYYVIVDDNGETFTGWVYINR